MVISGDFFTIATQKVFCITIWYHLFKADFHASLIHSRLIYLLNCMLYLLHCQYIGEYEKLRCELAHQGQQVFYNCVKFYSHNWNQNRGQMNKVSHKAFGKNLLGVVFDDGV